MRVRRSLSQVVFRFLPEQTVDLDNAVWRIERWVEPRTLLVDADVVRGELIRASHRWSATGRDGGFAERLRQGENIHVVTPSEEGGVLATSFPQNYRCRQCGRIERTAANTCRCGSTHWAQVPFVAYHECGKLDTPWIPRCQQHDQVRVDFPRTTATSDLRFECPVCHAEISRGFRFLKCECGNGNLSYNVHRAASVYTAHSTVIVNPPSQQSAARFRSEAAADQTLAWVLTGMAEDDPLAGRPTVDALVADLVGRGVPEATARKMAAIAAEEAGSVLAAGDPLGEIGLQPDELQEAREAALRLAFAVGGGRTRVDALEAAAGPTASVRYQQLYPRAIEHAGCEAVELLDDFPVLTAVYGYTRGGYNSNDAALQSFRGPGGSIRVHGQLANTEGLLFRLDPLKVGAWLHKHAFLPAVPSSAAEARGEILRRGVIPRAGEVVEPPTFGSAVATLVHSYAHRVIRRISAFCGIDRESLSEYLIPLHLSFVVFASTRGDFVLGGLQALFENDLEKALSEIVDGERRCPLDPGCAKHGGACVGCLHIGEPSCRLFNGFLSLEAPIVGWVGSEERPPGP